MQGSIHNDAFVLAADGTVTCATNHAEGVLAGISTGIPITFKTAFKPPSSIKKDQANVTREGESTTLSYGKGSRHDACF